MPQTFSSEVRGTESNISVRVESGTFYTRYDTIATDASLRPLRTLPENDSAISPYGNVGIGLFDRFEVLGQVGYLGPAVIGYDFMAALQYQILGQTRAEANGPGFSWTIGGQGHLSSGGDNRGDQNGMLGPGGYDWSAKSRYGAWGPQTAVGWRWSPKHLVTLGFAYLQYDIESSVYHAPSRDGTSAGNTYNFDGKGEGKTASANFVYGRNIYISAGAAYFDTSVPFTGQRKELKMLLSVGFNNITPDDQSSKDSSPVGSDGRVE